MKGGCKSNDMPDAFSTSENITSTRDEVEGFVVGGCLCPGSRPPLSTLRTRKLIYVPTELLNNFQAPTA